MHRFLIVSLSLLATLPGAEVVLQAPLSTVVHFGQALPPGDKTIVATLVVPADAPDDLGIGAFVSDRHTGWFQRTHGRIGPGHHELRFVLADGEPLLSEPGVCAWSAAAAGIATKAGVFFWSASASRARITIESLKVITVAGEVAWTPTAAAAAATEPVKVKTAPDKTGKTPPDKGAPDEAKAKAAAPPAPVAAAELPPLVPIALHELRFAGTAITGERWSLGLRPDPFPVNPYDPNEFAVDALITGPDGAERRIPGFFIQPMRTGDRGDSESVEPAGLGSFSVRFRPGQPGSYQVRLEARWRDAPIWLRDLPPLEVAGAPWDDYARVDPADPRFFSANGKFFWPLGPSMHSVTDLRARDRLKTRPTAKRGSLAYHSYFERAAAAGVTTVEIWMSSWNLALEWRGDWPGYYGKGRYNQEHAWQLDQILDDAWRHGIRINLVVNNHGQASANSDREWPSNPYHIDQGGRLAKANEFFVDPWALAGQDSLRRYLAARYADHPAILGWKLWSEVNLTGGGPALVKWHQDAANRWHKLDTYHHGVTTHWYGDYTSPDRNIIKLPELDYVCIDAYHDRGRMLADLVYGSTLDPNRGLGQFHKPVLITEFGGSAGAGPQPQLLAEHASGPWAAMVSGNGGAPMLWWIEWIDQGDLWQPYHALSQFLIGEDLRGAGAKGVAFDAQSSAGKLWARAWTREGRMLGYVLDEEWATNGLSEPLHDQARITIGSDIPAGVLELEWWDPAAGRLVVPTRSITHPGGALVLTPPPFKRHVAFKLYRGTT